MSTMTGAEVERRTSFQPVISHNVRILMAHKGVDQRGLAAVIGKSPASVGHKLAGRADWSVDELAELSLYGGRMWPVARFFNDPDDEEPTVANVRPLLRSIKGGGRVSTPRSPLLQPV